MVVLTSEHTDDKRISAKTYPRGSLLFFLVALANIDMHFRVTDR